MLIEPTRGWMHPRVPDPLVAWLTYRVAWRVDGRPRVTFIRGRRARTSAPHFEWLLADEQWFSARISGGGLAMWFKPIGRKQSRCWRLPAWGGTWIFDRIHSGSPTLVDDQVHIQYTIDMRDATDPVFIRALGAHIGSLPSEHMNSADLQVGRASFRVPNSASRTVRIPSTIGPGRAHGSKLARLHCSR
jgi:hypothetical protein